ncbi:pyridoxal phosphate-dependent decarboxylase family protein [Prochlorococcus sp. MIT 1307]|uniref:pyridoxal phosphate-dependent decarboxylase family protein n=1 Tax=Prochlorococcus sp. MIT 1307 TaxID=3096219 RepID=UPI002A74F4D9|nr:pyridoxal-dependent decarboxylase [Prochlorococcus sp. MIT 1307]
MAGNKHIKPGPSLEPFASPDHLDLELQSFLEDASSRLCDWFGKASQNGPLPALSVMPGVAPALDGLTRKALLDDLQLIMDGAFQPSHPGSLAHLDPPPLTASIVADLICAGLNNNLLAEELSPSLSRLERMLCQWFTKRLGMPPQSGGVAASGGSLSNLMALVVARQYLGLQNEPKAVVLASEDAHVCLAKAVRVMGLDEDALQKVGTNNEGQISIELLQSHLNRLRSEGRKCFVLVATAGTTVRGAIDPLVELGRFCAREDLWFHVDGAIGGIFALSKQTNSIVNGISSADSVTINPQKLLGITKASSLLLVANRLNLIQTFSTGLPYIEPAWGEDAHGGEMGIQGTRPAEVLKLWLGLRQLGEKGIERLLKDSIDRRRSFQKQLDVSKLSVITGPLHLISCTPKSFNQNQSARWSKETRRSLLDEKFMLSRPFHNDRYYLKAVMGNPHTQLTHLSKLANLLNHSVGI